MLFVITGVLLILMKIAEVGPVAGWAWWWVLSPFALATIWWWWADTTGLTKKREMDKMDAKRDARRERHLENLGLGTKSKRNR